MCVGDAHLADVVQQRAAANVHQLGLGQAVGARQPQRQLGDALGMALRLMVAQVQRPRPAFDGGVVGHGQVEVRALQAVEQAGVVDGDSRQLGQRFEELQPLGHGPNRRAVVDLQHAHHAALGDERRAKVGAEAFLGRQRRAGGRRLAGQRRGGLHRGDIGHAHQPPLEHHAGGIVGRQPVARRLVGAAEAAPGGNIERAGLRVEQAHGGRVNL